MKSIHFNKSKHSVRIARLLVFALLIGLFSGFCSTDALAADKALSIKASFNGKRTDSDANINANSYVVNAFYKKAVKPKSGMKGGMTIYVPVSALKKSEDMVHINVNLSLNDVKNDTFLGDILGKYSLVLYKDGKKVKLIRWNNAKQRQEVCKKSFATFKKSGKYYVITVKNMPYESVYHDSNGKSAKLSSLSGSKFYINQMVSFTGLCSKTKKAALYVDDLTLKAGTTQKITFDKKDYRYTWGWYIGTNSEYKVSVSAVK